MLDVFVVALFAKDEACAAAPTIFSFSVLLSLLLLRAYCRLMMRTSAAPNVHRGVRVIYVGLCVRVFVFACV